MGILMQDRSLIVGGGAVGQGIASFLIGAGRTVTLVARGATAQSLRRQGLHRIGVLGSHVAPPSSFSVAGSVADVDSDPFDAVYVCVKAYDSESVADELAGRSDLFHDGTRLILCQNGWGNAETFAVRFSRGRVLNARLLTGFDRLAPATVQVTAHAREVLVGSLFDPGSPGAEGICKALSAGGLPARPSPCIARDLWEKMCFNCTLNPLGAILDAKLGDIAGSTRIRLLLDALVREVFEVMHANGYEAHSPTADRFLSTFYQELLPATADHCTSMLQDLRAGRRTEIDALNGVIIRLGERAGLAATCNRFVHGLVCFLEGRPRWVPNGSAPVPPATIRPRTGRRISTAYAPSPRHRFAYQPRVDATAPRSRWKETRRKDISTKLDRAWENPTSHEGVGLRRAGCVNPPEYMVD
jgi:2-dehydropantoate 2-reductase